MMDAQAEYELKSLARLRVYASSELKEHAGMLLNDELDNLPEHLRWISTAATDEILTWCKSVKSIAHSATKTESQGQKAKAAKGKAIMGLRRDAASRWMLARISENLDWSVSEDLFRGINVERIAELDEELDKVVNRYIEVGFSIGWGVARHPEQWILHRDKPSIETPMARLLKGMAAMGLDKLKTSPELNNDGVADLCDEALCAGFAAGLRAQKNPESMIFEFEGEGE